MQDKRTRTFSNSTAQLLWLHVFSEWLGYIWCIVFESKWMKQVQLQMIGVYCIYIYLIASKFLPLWVNRLFHRKYLKLTVWSNWVVTFSFNIHTCILISGLVKMSFNIILRSNIIETIEITYLLMIFREMFVSIHW